MYSVPDSFTHNVANTPQVYNISVQARDSFTQDTLSYFLEVQNPVTLTASMSPNAPVKNNGNIFRVKLKYYKIC